MEVLELLTCTNEVKVMKDSWIMLRSELFPCSKLIKREINEAVSDIQQMNGLFYEENSLIKKQQGTWLSRDKLQCFPLCLHMDS